MNLDDYWANAFWSLAPSIAIGVMFWLVIRAVIRADRGERDAYARMEQQLRRELDKKRASGAGRGSEGNTGNG